MVHQRRNLLAFAVLLVYLTAIISGGLHHHEPVRAAHSEPTSLKDVISVVNSCPAHSNEESEDCTVCIASHQAKTPSAVISLAVAFVPVGDSVMIPVASPIASVPFVNQARAPPIL